MSAEDIVNAAHIGISEPIECDECKCILNDKPICIVGEAEEALILCEKCCKKFRDAGRYDDSRTYLPMREL